MINKTENIIDKNCNHFIKSCISRRSKTAKHKSFYKHEHYAL